MARRIAPAPSPLDAFLATGIVFSLTGVAVVALLEVSRRAGSARDWSDFYSGAAEVAAACAVCGPIIAWIGALALFHRPARGPLALEGLVCLVLTAPVSVYVSALLLAATALPPHTVFPGQQEWVVSPHLARLGTPALVAWLAAFAWRLRRPRPTRA